MPRPEATLNMPMKNYETEPQTPPAPAPQFQTLPNPMARHPLMLASLPNVGSAPDAILRQHLGGRATTAGRLFSL